MGTWIGRERYKSIPGGARRAGLTQGHWGYARVSPRSGPLGSGAEAELQEAKRRIDTLLAQIPDDSGVQGLRPCWKA